MSQRLSRKEIKRDELAEAVGRTVDYATSHVRLLVTAAVAVVAVVLIAVGIFIYLGHRSAQAAELLSQGINVYGAEVGVATPRPNDPVAPSFADDEARRARARELFGEVRKRFGGTDSGAIARVYLGRMAAAEGDFAAAREHWEAFLDKAPDEHVLASEVQLNLLKLELDQGAPEEVATRLEAMLREPDKPMPEDLILYQLAAVRERLGRTDEALSAYQRIVDEFPRSPYGTLAQQRTQALSAGGLAS